MHYRGFSISLLLLLAVVAAVCGCTSTVSGQPSAAPGPRPISGIGADPVQWVDRNSGDGTDLGARSRDQHDASAHCYRKQRLQCRVSPSGQNAYVANNASRTVSVIDTATDKVVGTVPVDMYPSDLAVTPDGRRVYVITADGSDVAAVLDTYEFCGLDVRDPR